MLDKFRSSCRDPIYWSSTVYKQARVNFSPRFRSTRYGPFLVKYIITLSGKWNTMDCILFYTRMLSVYNTPLTESERIMPKIVRPAEQPGVPRHLDDLDPARSALYCQLLWTRYRTL